MIAKRRSLLALAMAATIGAGCDGGGEEQTSGPLPDLVPTAVGFDADGVLEFTMENQGEAEVPAEIGSVSIAVDGRIRGGYSFPVLADQSFRAPGGSITIRTNFRLAGEDRRVGIHVDSGAEIAESNEFQNTLTRSLTPPVIAGPDLVLGPFAFSEQDGVSFSVRNVGTAPSPAGQVVTIRVIVNESVAADLTETLPELAPGDAHAVEPAPPIHVNPGDEVRALLNTPGLFDEIDNDNNVREEVAGGPSFAPYTALLANPLIRDNIVWELAGGGFSYGAWSAAMKSDLEAAVLRLERGERQPMTAPPSIDANHWMSAADGWAIFVEHVAQSLWVEVHNAVPWSLTGYGPAELEQILDSRKLLSRHSGTGKYRFHVGTMGNATSWNPRFAWEFLSTLRVIRPTPLATVEALTDWMRGHLIHIAAGTDFLEQYGYEGLHPVEKVLYPFAGKRHITDGCWGTSALYSAILRTANIPVEHARTELGGGSHSRPSFLSVDRSMPHGDDPYTTLLLPSGEVIASSELLFTGAQMNSLFLAPTVDCDGSDCNTVGEQASYNRGKEHLQSAIDVGGDFLLYEYALDGATGLRDALRGPSIGGSIVEYVNPYFTPAERDTIVAQVEGWLTTLGDGDIEAGKTKVIQRVGRWGSNK